MKNGQIGSFLGEQGKNSEKSPEMLKKKTLLQKVIYQKSKTYNSCLKV